VRTLLTLRSFATRRSSDLVENDANAAAFGEVCASRKLQNKTCVVTVTLGTGIGVGIVINGRVYRGAHFAAGECGHIKIAMDNKRDRKSTRLNSSHVKI